MVCLHTIARRHLESDEWGMSFDVALLRTVLSPSIMLTALVSAEQILSSVVMEDFFQIFN